MSNLIVLRSEPTLEILRSERCDISVINTEAVGSDKMIVKNDGLNWERFQEDGSPVHLEHRSVRVGRALWVKNGDGKIRAKTQYDAAPQSWPVGKPWLGDMILDAVSRGRLPGKSLTLLREHDRKPTEEEAKLGADVVIDKATVLEYSVCGAPVNPEALVEEIRRSLSEGTEEEYLDELTAQLKSVFEELKAGGR